ncbi:MAG: ShlB/FhaC/HecB family hemolysin secretion/activation protein [Nitrospirota bacterium]
MTNAYQEKDAGSCSVLRRLARFGAIVALGMLSLAWFFAAPPAYGQTAGDPTAVEELRRKQRQLEEEDRRKRQAPEVQLEGEPRAAETFELPAESPCFPIHTIVLEGEQSDRFSWLRDDVAPYVDKCIGREGINLIVKRLMGRLIDRSYVTTRIGVPEQDISSGVLRLALVPGVISDIRFADEAMRGTWKTAFPSGRGDLLNLRDLEQGLEQMKRVPYQDVDLKIKPGVQPGESDVVLGVEREKAWRASLSLDDSGSTTTGKLQAGAGFAWDNPLGINDLLSLSWNHDAATKHWLRRTGSESMYYSVPYGYWTLSAQGSVSSYRQTVEGTVTSFQYSGTTRTADATVQRVIHRGRVSRTGLQFRLGKRESRTYLDDTEIEVQRREQADAELGLFHRRSVGKATVDVTAAFRKGVPWLNAQPDPAYSAPDGPTTRYKIGTLDVTTMIPFTLWSIPMQYRNRGRAQYTADRLLVADQFSIGNRYTVRGFDGAHTLLAERGWYLRNELGMPIFKTRQEFYLGIDHGAVKGPSDELLAGKSLTGGVIGVRGKYKGFFYDAFSGWPLRKPDGFRTERPAAGFQVTWQY